MPPLAMPSALASVSTPAELNDEVAVEPKSAEISAVEVPLVCVLPGKV